ncbi:hypothetical protein NQZ68_012126 [Dissostichus eleginoides]|nr:hypothetical protein NQZ68_012126 [Dissostichus eleginoides]
MDAKIYYENQTDEPIKRFTQICMQTVSGGRVREFSPELLLSVRLKHTEDVQIIYWPGLINSFTLCRDKALWTAVTNEDTLLLGARSICLHISGSERGGGRHTLRGKKMEIEHGNCKGRENGRIWEEIRGTVELDKQKKLLDRQTALWRVRRLKPVSPLHQCLLILQSDEHLAQKNKSYG